MDKTNEKYGAYLQILKEELVPAMGCTEPIAIASRSPSRNSTRTGCSARYVRISARCSSVTWEMTSGPGPQLRGLHRPGDPGHLPRRRPYRQGEVRRGRRVGRQDGRL